jgi:hypothetical protein
MVRWILSADRRTLLETVIEREFIVAIIDANQEIELKKVAAQLTASMLDNNSGDWDDAETAEAFKTIYAAVRDA